MPRMQCETREFSTGTGRPSLATGMPIWLAERRAGRLVCRGGAIWASGRLVLRSGTVLHQNIAEGGASAAQGGGVYSVFATVHIDCANFTGNEARQRVTAKPDGELTAIGGLYAEGGALFLFQQVLRNAMFPGWLAASCFSMNIGQRDR